MEKTMNQEGTVALGPARSAGQGPEEEVKKADRSRENQKKE